MNYGLTTSSGSWLTKLNNKTIDKIFQVDFNEDRHEDIYLPWLFFVTFSDFDKFLEIEGDFDGSHIKMKLNEKSELNQKLNENNLPNEPYLWRVYNTEKDAILGKLLGQKIEFLEFGIDKSEIEINGNVIKGQQDLFTFVRINYNRNCLTIFEGSATGLEVSTDRNVKVPFEETFETYSTKHNC